MIKLNFYRSNHDSCIYFKEVSSGCFIYLLLYVDDILLACKSLIEIQKLKLLLNGEFEMKDLGTARKILGMEIRRNKSIGKMYLTQKDYLEKGTDQVWVHGYKTSVNSSVLTVQIKRVLK